jgi:hypothetical protein
MAMRPRSYTEDQRQRVLAGRRAGDSVAALVQALGLSVATVRSICAKAGVRLTPDQRRANSGVRTGGLELEAQAVALRLAGTPVKDIAARLGLTGAKLKALFRRKKVLVAQGVRTGNAAAGRRASPRVRARRSDAQAYREGVFRQWQALGVARGGVCLAPGYVRSNRKCGWRCAEGHLWSATPGRVRAGTWCPVCGGTSRKDIEWLRALADGAGLTCLSGEYTNNRDKHSYGCNACGHVFSVPAYSIQAGHGCPRCALTYGKAQGDLAAVVQSLVGPGVEVRTDVKGVLPGRLELDVYVPALGLALEYCGLRWHGEKRRGVNVHVDKLRACQTLGIRLLTVFEPEWLSRRAAVLGYLKSILCRPALTRVSARDCEVRPLGAEPARTFLAEYHIQGAINGRSWGLYAPGGELVAAVVYRHVPGRPGWQDLCRYCVRSGVNVRGGLGKLQAEALLALGCRGVLTFSDSRWSSGNLYRALGFAPVAEVAPSYSYFREGTKGPLLYKSTFRKERIPGIAPGETEWAAMQRLGYDRIWDCGKVKWELQTQETQGPRG